MAVHREHAIGRDQPAAGARGLAQALFELAGVAVRVAQPARLAEPHTVDDRGVVEGVGDDRVVLAEQRLEEPGVGVEAGRVENRVLATEECADPRLELAVDVLRTADEAHRRHAVAALAQHVARRRQHGGMVGQAEVVVGTQVEQLAPVGQRHVRPLRRGDHALLLGQPGLRDLIELALELLPHSFEHHCSQSSTTLPLSPLAAIAKACSNSL